MHCADSLGYNAMVLLSLLLYSYICLIFLFTLTCAFECVCVFYMIAAKKLVDGNHPNKYIQMYVPICLMPMLHFLHDGSRLGFIHTFGEMLSLIVI